MDEIIIDLLAFTVGFGPLFFALRNQEKKEKEESETARRKINKMCENIKENS